VPRQCIAMGHAVLKNNTRGAIPPGKPSQSRGKESGSSLLGTDAPDLARGKALANGRYRGSLCSSPELVAENDS